MKTAKFLAMLMAAFTLSFSLVSCGDDDEPTPTPSGDNSAQVDNNNNPATGGDNTPLGNGELRMLGESGFIRYAMAYPVSSKHIETMLSGNDFDDPDAWNGPQTMMMMDLRGVFTDDEGHIPTGVYPYIENAGNSNDIDMWDEGYKRCYEFGGGSINTEWVDDKCISGCEFTPTDDCGPLVVERNGEEYTLTISNLKVEAKNLVTNETQVITTSFTYKGKINIVGDR